jgi:hypothetical protein
MLDVVDNYERDFNTSVTVVLARVINRTPVNAATTTYNGKLETYFNNRKAKGDKILLVDMENDAGLVYKLQSNGGDMVDDKHPAPSGYEKMAPVWFNAIKTKLGGPTSTDTAPEITSTPDKTAQVGESYSYDVNATGSPVPTYSLTTAPAGMQISASSGLISWTPSAAGSFAVTVKATNSAGSVSQSYTVTVASSTPTTGCSASGTILREYWLNVSGTSVADIPVNTTPTGTEQITSFAGPNRWGDNYGQRIRGYICPPQTGNYVFSLAGDDDTQLWLSTDDNPANKELIVSANNATRKSGSIQLETGKRYYIEALHKEVRYGDYITVGWQLPNGSQELPIPGSRLSPYQGASMTSSSSQALSISQEINAIPENAQLTAYPNPFQDEVYFRVNAIEQGQVTLEIYDMQGKLIKEVANRMMEANSSETFKMDARHLPRGVYIAKLRTGKEVYTTKLILNR